MIDSIGWKEKFEKWERNGEKTFLASLISFVKRKVRKNLFNREIVSKRRKLPIYHKRPLDWQLVHLIYKIPDPLFLSDLWLNLGMNCIIQSMCTRYHLSASANCSKSIEVGNWTLQLHSTFYRTQHISATFLDDVFQFSARIVRSWCYSSASFMERRCEIEI